LPPNAASADFKSVRPHRRHIRVRVIILLKFKGEIDEIVER
jgi:hypothetical protein